MPAKNSRTHGFIVHTSLFVAYDPAKPESVTAASKKLAELVATIAEDVVVVKSSAPVPHSISSPTPPTGG